MTELESAAVSFFRALRAVGNECFGHDQFGFKVDINTMSRAEDQAKALTFNTKVQEALTFASSAPQPVTIEGTSLQ
jgi:hypothetical protein